MSKVGAFTVQKKSRENFGRVGELILPHGKIQTPIFMPCGTKGSVKTLEPRELSELGVEIILCNTYHLHLRPGEELIGQMGGLHKWINWPHPILTDSGGFQVFSLSKMNKIDADGVTFRSHLDGSTQRLTPEKAIAIQHRLGSDIVMAFDECASAEAEKKYVKEAMLRTHAWLEKSARAHREHDDNSLFFPIIQGGLFTDLRRESLDFCLQYAQNGLAIGGLSVGESKEEMREVLDYLAPHLPESQPRYLMGVGTPEDLISGVEQGIDMFDCVLPTRLARHGAFWSRSGRHNIRNEVNRRAEEPLDPTCSCHACRFFSRSYLRHLFLENEILGLKLLTVHNLHFLLELMRSMREAILSDTFARFKQDFFATYRLGSFNEKQK